MMDVLHTSIMSSNHHHHLWQAYFMHVRLLPSRGFWLNKYAGHCFACVAEEEEKVNLLALIHKRQVAWADD
jgi:hypothetical protein